MGLNMPFDKYFSVWQEIDKKLLFKSLAVMNLQEVNTDNVQQTAATFAHTHANEVCIPVCALNSSTETALLRVVNI